MRNKTRHTWINYPNSAHKKCTRCGCKMDKISNRYITKVTYTLDKIESDKLPECKS